jgi:Zn-dependent protease
MEPFSLIFIIIIFLLSVVIHEVSHGAVANMLGDPTAKLAGRLTLNPIKHLDPIGSIFLPLILILMSMTLGGGVIFGWAKPVPINPYNLKDQKYGEAKVAIAGPLSNIFIAVLFGLSLRFLPETGILFFQNLEMFFGYIVWVNLLLAVFNLLPIPPLDGSHILFTFLPLSLNTRMALERYGFLILIFVIFFLLKWIVVVILWLYQLIVGTLPPFL